MTSSEKSPSFQFDPEKSISLRKHAARSAGLTIGGQGLKFVFRLGSMAVMARMLSPSDYGLVAMATSVTAILGALREAGLSSATIQRPKITQVEVSSLFILNIALGFVVACICWAIAPLAATFFKHEELLSILPALGAVGFVASFGVQHMAIMQRRLEFRQLVARDLFGQVAGVAAGITAAKMGAGYWSLVIMEASSVIVSTAAVWLGCRWRPSLPIDISQAWPLVKFGASVTGAALAHHFSKGLDTIVLGHFFGSSTVGLYSRAQLLLSTPMNQVVNPIMSVSRPLLSRAAEDPEKLNRATFELLSVLSFMSAAMVATLVPISDGIVNLLLGSQWLAAIPLFVALAPFAIVEPCAALLASVLIASGRPGVFLRWRLVSILYVIGGLAAGISWGPVGAAAAYAGTGLLIRMPQFVLLVAKHSGIPASRIFKALLPNIALCAITIPIVVAARSLFPDPKSLVSTAALAALSAAVFALLSLTNSPTRTTLQKIRDMGLSIINKEKPKTKVSEAL